MTAKTPESTLDDIRLVPEPAADQLNDKQQTVYKEHRRKLATWALSMPAFNQ